MTHDWRKIANTLITQPEGRPWRGWHDFRHFFSRRLRKSGVPPEAPVRPDGTQQGEPRAGRVRPGGRARPEGRVVTRCYAEEGGGVRICQLCGAWWALQDLNLGPMDYESTALTAELRAR